MGLFPGSTGLAFYDVAEQGTLAYVVGGPRALISRSLTTVDRAGTPRPIVENRRDYWRPRLSPDGSRIAVEVWDERGLQIWIVDVASGSASQLTLEGLNNWAAVWTPDGESVIFASDRGGFYGAYRQAADGSGQATLVRRSNQEIVTSDVSGEGVLAFTEGGDTGERTIWTLQLRDGLATEFLATPALELMPMFSPDGRWLAYASTESGRMEVYVRPYPRTEGGVRRVSDEGGTAPVWARDGSTLFYRSNAGFLTAVPVQIGRSSVTIGRPVPLFQVTWRYRVSGQLPAYDVGPSKDSFLMVTEPEDQRPAVERINLVLNWTEELERLVRVR
jgi:serine/threonine-protein kinase